MNVVWANFSVSSYASLQRFVEYVFTNLDKIIDSINDDDYNILSEWNANWPIILE